MKDLKVRMTYNRNNCDIIHNTFPYNNIYVDWYLTHTENNIIHANKSFEFQFRDIIIR